MTRPCQHAVYPRCGCDIAFAPTLRPPPAERPTTPVPGPDKVAAYLRHRATITARWADCDALWDAMTEREHDAVVTELGEDWRPRR